ncbi:MAG: DNA polymerase III subunit alpha [Pseudobdellovibrionaceae bacterium]
MSKFPIQTTTSATVSPKQHVQFKGFVELLARSNFSFLQAASFPEEMVEQALRLDYQGLALCDLNGLYGVARGFQTAHSPSLFTASVHVNENFRYMIGTELILTDQSSITLLPLNKNGYSRLCELLTLGKRQATKGFSQLSLEDVERDSTDLLCFVLPPVTDEKFIRLQKHFGDRLYVPVWRDLTWESRQFYKQALHLEKNFAAQLFVTNRPLMATADRKALFDVVTCICHHQTIDEARNILIQNSERHLKPLEELQDLWRDRLDLLNETLEIAERVEFSLDQIRYRYPQAQLPLNLTASQHLAELVHQGLQRRHPSAEIPPEMTELADYELKIIKQLEYEDYFLTLHEICQFAKSRGILYQGRGSAANSVICYALELTAVDPIQMGLLFERFISPERNEPPDIDIDFEHSRREEVIQHIYEKYNERHAAMVCTVIRYRSRMAFRETAKVFGLPLVKINAMVKFMGRDGIRRLLEPGTAERFHVSEETLQLILTLAKELHGFPRHLGIHTGGFLITQDPITEMVPVEKATMNGRYVIQWNKDDINTLKLMKIDILSLGMLTALRKCFELLKTHKNKNAELYNLKQEDTATYEMICKAETVGVFQIESRAQMNTLPRLKPKTFYDLVVEVALVRPGPLQGGMVHPYLQRRQNKEKVAYAHPDLEPILKKTLGVPIFQEQVMKIVVAVAGFTPGEADELRRIMSNAWRKKGSMDGIRDRIMQGMKKHGLEAQYAEQIYKTIEGFANYGFPESHAASFALLTYASSYLKCHHPDVFACALLNSQPMGFYPPRVIINEAQRNGVLFQPLDIQNSNFDYTLEEEPQNRWLHGVRTGLRSIYGMPEKFVLQIERDRQERGAYQDLKDFIRRNLLPKNALLKLAAAGAFQSFEADVRKIIWHIESLSLDSSSFLWGQPKESFSPSRSLIQSELGDLQILQKEIDDAQLIPFESNWDLMLRESNTKGFSLDHHPMQVLRPWVERCNDEYRRKRFILFSDSGKLQSLKHKQKIRVAGLISVTQRPPTAKGMCFITLEDEFGFMNLVIPPVVYQRDRMIIYQSAFLHVCGVLEKNGPVMNVKVERLYPFLHAIERFENVNTGVSS